MRPAGIPWPQTWPLGWRCPLPGRSLSDRMPVCEGASLAEPPETTAPDPVACPPGRWRRRVGLAVGACSCLYLVTVLGLWALLGVADLWWPATLFLFSPRWLLALP